MEHEIARLLQEALNLADAMAAAAAQFNTQNYSVFLESRQQLLQILEDIKDIC